DEVFAPVARVEAIRLFLAYASFMGFIVYMMDVKSAFLYNTIEKEVYVCQPPGFEDPHFPNKVYKKSLCYEFEQMMHKRFQMSSMRELTFFLGLQVKQKDDEIFIIQDKSMIGSLMYFTASRPDIMFAVCACTRFQVTPKTSHLHAVKRIFRYLKGLPKLGLWYPRDSSFDSEAFFDSDYAGASFDQKSTTGGCQLLGKRLISWQCKKKTIVSNSTTEAEYVAAANCCGQIVDFVTSSTIHYALTVSPTNDASYIGKFWATAKFKTVNDVKQIHAKVDGKTVVISESSMRSDLYFNDEDGEDDRVVRAATIAAILEAEQESGNINKTPPTAILNEPSPHGTGSGSGPKHHVTTLGDTDAQTRFETASKQSHDPPLSEVNTSGSKEDSMEHQDDLMDFVPLTPHDSPLSEGHTPRSDKGRPNIHELMNIYTQLSNRVLALEQFKTAQDLVIKRLQKKVKRMEKKQRVRTPRMKHFKIGTSKKRT
nr:hypothetical protein [Tanacetum cinerariifolium]